MEWFTTWTTWHWLILGFILLIAEIIIPGVFLLWWGIAAIIVTLLAALFSGVSLPILAVVYVIIASILSVLWWKYQHRKDSSDQIKSKLNQRDHAMLGSTGVIQEIQPNGIGRGYFGDTTWRVQGGNLSVGDVVKVLAVDGITLIVEKQIKKDI